MRDSMNRNGDEFALPYVIEYRPSLEFNNAIGQDKLTSLRLFSDGDTEVSFVTPGDDQAHDLYREGKDIIYTRRQGRLLRLSALIDLESRLTVGCAGALLTYIGRRKAVEYLPGDESGSTCFQISSIEMFSLKSTMFVNANTLLSLGILQSESSPNVHNQGPTKASSGSKEGLSVYGLFHNFAKTSQGKALLRQYFLRPSLDIDVINERLEAVSVLLRPENSSLSNSIVKNMGQIKNMKTILIHLRKGISDGASKGGGIKNGIWSSLRSVWEFDKFRSWLILKFAYHTLQIRDALNDVSSAQSLTIGVKVLEQFDTLNIARVGTDINNIVDFAASAEMHRTVVKTGVDDDLDALKRSYDGLEDLLDRASQEIAATVPTVYDLNLNVIFFPQIGFLISIPLNELTGRGDYEGEEGTGQSWDRIFSTVNRVYYKESRTMELDEAYGDIYAVICEKEIEIVHELGQRILAKERALTLASDICGELDCLLALAQGAKFYNFCRPSVTRENIIQIKCGRHPLQELTVPSYVANDTFLIGGRGGNLETRTRQSSSNDYVDVFQGSPDSAENEGPSMVILTGPNYSGKSVYLKQIALIVYMAHVGCFVPADRATIGLTDKILTRIAARETVSRSHSAFMIDLQQVAFAMKLATSRSLIIIDEFGKGTNSRDGAGLACGVFGHFLGLGNEKPKVLVATHFHEIFEHRFLSTQSSLKFGYMEVFLDKKSQDPENQITYLYTFRSGRSTTSYGGCCAALSGIDTAIIKRADELAELTASGEDLVAACAIISQQEECDLKNAEELARDFLARNLRDDVFKEGLIGEAHESQGLLENLLDPGVQQTP